MTENTTAEYFYLQPIADTGKLEKVLVRPDFWNLFPKNPHAFENFVGKGIGITVFFKIGHTLGAGLKPEYNGIATTELYKVHLDWVVDTKAFELKYPPAWVEGIKQMMPHVHAEREAWVNSYNAGMDGLPKPPEDYYWTPFGRSKIRIINKFGALDFEHVRLWSHMLGLMPGSVGSL